MPSPTLIILRGPSGSGKTTIAKRLFDQAKRRTVLIEQDYYRFIFNPPGGGTKPNSDAIHEMIKNDVLVAIRHGYDVILEGILSIEAYKKVLDAIFQQHPENNYMFYFDVSFEETVKRHKRRQATRPNQVGNKTFVQDIKRHERLQEFGKKEMKEWYASAHRSNHWFEHIIPENFTIKDTVKYIKEMLDSRPMSPAKKRLTLLSAFYHDRISGRETSGGAL